MMLFDGVGRVQKRGERMRVLRKGDTEYAGAGVEHWHGASTESSAQFFQTSIGVTTTLWMEEVGNDDYMGNDTGINSRNEFLKTGTRKTIGRAGAEHPAESQALTAIPGETGGHMRGSFSQDAQVLLLHVSGSVDFSTIRVVPLTRSARASFTACAISPRMYGSSRTAASLSTRIERTLLPAPSSRPFGSSSATPSRKKNRTQRG